MFKRDKHTVVSTRSLLKNRDIRRLRKDVCQQWGCHEDELKKVLPNKVRCFPCRIVFTTCFAQAHAQVSVLLFRCTCWSLLRTE